MRRYQFLVKEEIFSALNKLRNAFLAAKNGREVEEIINGLLTYDEKMKIGRRIQVAECLLNTKMTFEEISKELKVGRTTISLVSTNIEKYPKCFDLIQIRGNKVERVYREKRFRDKGGSTKIQKEKVYTGFKRGDVDR